MFQERTVWFCEGGVDVVGVVTPLRGVAQVVLHGDQVVELSVLLGVHQEGEVEEDGEGQVEVEREEGEVKERRSLMCDDGMKWDSRTPWAMRCMWHWHHKKDEDGALYVPCSQVVQLARVGVRVLVVDVVCVVLVLIARVDICAVYVQFS